MSISDLAAPSPSGASVTQANPSVSKAQWASYALKKLGEGYLLLQAPNGKVFHFAKAGELMMPCAPHAARKLIEMGLLTVARVDGQGTHYALAESFQSDEPRA